MTNPSKDRLDELEIIALPDIFRGIGPGDDVVVSTEKLLAWHSAAVVEARISEVEWSLHHLGLTDKDRESNRLKKRRQELGANHKESKDG